MRERLARAIIGKVPYGYGMTATEAQQYADAVLDELMTPTDEMLDAVGGSGAPNLKRSVFIAMIKAAKEGK